MALLARNALSSRRPGQVGAARALLGAVVLTSALGVADEGVQWLLPQRVFDLRDIWLNVGAVVVGLALDEALHDRTGLRARLLVPTATGGDP